MLLAVVLGHAAMAVLHRVLWREDVLHRMLPGGRRSAGPAGGA